MKTVRPWVEALGISEDDYQRWCSSVPADESVTFRCLFEGRIPVDAYLDWARDHYGLAILRGEFFLKPANAALFEKMKSVSNWSREIFPIHEWDGVIFVACVEPSEVKWSYPVQQVLASPADMEKFWNSLNGQKPEAKKEIATEVIAAFPPAPTAAVPLKDTFTNSAIANPPKKEADPFEALSAVLKDTAVATNVIEGIDMGAAATAVNVDLAIPEGIAMDAGTFEAPSGLEGLTNTLITIPKEEAIDLKTPDMPENTATAIRASTGVPAPEKAISMGKGQFESEATLRELANDFEGALVLKMTMDRLEPWAWDSHWSSPTPPSVDLSGPSAFRVVYRTKMPYLGHIVDTPTNTAFFSKWGLATLPDSVLVQPLIKDGTWVGMLLLKCDKNKKQSQLLSVADRVSLKLIDLISSSQAKAA